jgi:hypothetical protein
LRFRVLADLVPAAAKLQIRALVIDPKDGVRKVLKANYTNPAKAEINAQDNGLLLTTYRYADGEWRTQRVDPALGAIGAEPELRVRTRWTNQYRDQMNVEVFYLNQRIAEGVVNGRLFDRRYRPARGGQIDFNGGGVSFEGGYSYDGSAGFFEYSGSNFSFGISRGQ